MCLPVRIPWVVSPWSLPPLRPWMISPRSLPPLRPWMISPWSLPPLRPWVVSPDSVAGRLSGGKALLTASASIQVTKEGGRDGCFRPGSSHRRTLPLPIFYFLLSASLPPPPPSSPLLSEGEKTRSVCYCEAGQGSQRGPIRPLQIVIGSSLPFLPPSSPTEVIE